MTAKIALAAAVASLLSLSATAPHAVAKSPLESASKPARQCFWTHQVDNFASNDDKFVNVRVGMKEVYQFEMFGRCLDVDWSDQIALVSRSGSTICAGLDAEIVTRSAIGPQRCQVRNIRKLTPVEIAALPKGARP